VEKPDRLVRYQVHKHVLRSLAPVDPKLVAAIVFQEPDGKGGAKFVQAVLDEKGRVVETKEWEGRG
jgi:hypothetical protein